MSSNRHNPAILTDIISGVVKGLGEAVIGEVLGYNSRQSSDVHKDVNVIDMKKDDNDCWRMIENE